MEDKKRKTFTPEEDQILRDFVIENGNRNWSKIADILQNRTPRQCRDRYRNYLKEGLNMNPWTKEEDSIIKKKYHELGPKWVAISKLLNDRNGIDVKKRWRELTSSSRKRYKKHHERLNRDSMSYKKYYKKKATQPPAVQTKTSPTKDSAEKNSIDQIKDDDLTSFFDDNEYDDFDIGISEEEFYDILSFSDYISPIDKCSYLGSTKISTLF
ncbi:hypothetical protein M9Y10_015458 [Tritrichomonas musculus]|uniref:Myb-like DNA-binding domain containing protein n=1 Tax=Tritrichomonas musculus TaxID=1915356 RepID=A0ABR2L2D0_9EUKA